MQAAAMEATETNLPWPAADEHLDRQGPLVMMLTNQFRNEHLRLLQYIDKWGREQEQVLETGISKCFACDVNRSPEQYIHGDVQLQPHVSMGPQETSAGLDFQSVLTTGGVIDYMYDTGCKHDKQDGPQPEQAEQVGAASTLASTLESGPSTSQSGPSTSHITFLSSLKPKVLQEQFQVLTSSTQHDSPHTLQQKRRNSRLAAILDSDKFEMLVGIVIFANSVVMGISANYDMQHPSGPRSAELDFCELVFLSMYTIELALRIHVARCAFFLEPTWRWNLFDILLVASAIADQIGRVVSAESAALVGNYLVARMLRFMKVIRIFRVIRLMKVFRELRLMLHSISACVLALFWTVVLLMLVMYVVSVCILQVCSSLWEDLPDSADSGTKGQIILYWGHVGKAMLSLFQSSTGGTDWNTVADPLLEISAGLYALFCFYVGFFMFGVMNAVTSTFVDATMASSQADNNMVIQQELEKKEMYMKRLQTLFTEIDANNDGRISYSEFCRHLHSPAMHAFAASLDLDVTDTSQCFYAMTNHGETSIGLEAFVVACIHMKGFARSMDMLSLSRFTKEALKDLQSMVKDLQSQGEKRTCQVASLQQIVLSLMKLLPSIQQGGSHSLPSTTNEASRDPRFFSM